MTNLKMSIKSKLILLVLVTLIPLIALHLISIRNNYNQSIKDEVENCKNNANVITINFKNYLEENWTQQFAIGKAILSNPYWNSEDIGRYISDVLAEKQNVKGYSWISSDGVVLASSYNSVIGMDLHETEFYKRIKNGEKNAVSNLRKSIIDDSMVIDIAKGIYRDGELKGIMISVIDVNSLENVFTVKGEENVKFGLIDNSGRLVYMHKQNDISFEERVLDKDSPKLAILNSGMEVCNNSPLHYDYDERLGAACLIEGINWISFYSISSEAVFDKVLLNAKQHIMILIITLILSIAFAIEIGSRYSNFIDQLKDVAEEVSKGNLMVKTEFTGVDEIAVTSEAFNRMTEEFNYQLNKRDEIAMLKTQFLSTVSHELKTPINIILGAVQIMDKMDDKIKGSINKYIRMQKQNSYRLLRLINNLIDINKIESNQFEINRNNYDIVRLVEDITLSVVEYTELNSIEIIFDTDVEEKCIAVDPDKIERILLNLISNAIKFTDPGGKIEVSIWDKEDKVEISVKDTGIGIPEHMLESIFQYFTQVDNSFHRKVEGSGIGLSLVKSLVEMHGGTIGVNSTLGEGSEFIIELPVVLTNNISGAIKEISFNNVERISIEFSDIYVIK